MSCAILFGRSRYNQGETILDIVFGIDTCEQVVLWTNCISLCEAYSLSLWTHIQSEGLVNASQKKRHASLLRDYIYCIFLLGVTPFSLVHRTENIVGRKEHLGNFEGSQTTTRLSGGLSFAKLRKLVLFKLSCRKSLKVLGETIAFRAHSR